MTRRHDIMTACYSRELLLLTMTVSMCMLIMAGLAYALEKDEPDTMFYTLPQTLYWAIITMTSTGETLNDKLNIRDLDLSLTLLMLQATETWLPRLRAGS